MRLFLDSSAVAKRYIDERGSNEVFALCAEASELGISVICLPEVLSALCRLVREKKLTRGQYSQLKEAFGVDAGYSEICDLTPGVISIAAAVLEQTPSRALDAVHIACAVQWKADLFATADRRQLDSAREFGLSVREV